MSARWIFLVLSIWPTPDRSRCAIQTAETWGNDRSWHEAADHTLIADGRFRGEADMYGSRHARLYGFDRLGRGRPGPVTAPRCNGGTAPSQVWYLSDCVLARSEAPERTA